MRLEFQALSSPFRWLRIKDSQLKLGLKTGFKTALCLIFAALFITACPDQKPTRYVIADSKTYEASLFRQHCAICHGPEGDGKTLDDGKVVPSLREGELRKLTTEEIYQQIAEGGNGMTPFNHQLTDRELKLLVDLVHNDLRKK